MILNIQNPQEKEDSKVLEYFFIVFSMEGFDTHHEYKEFPTNLEAKRYFQNSKMDLFLQNLEFILNVYEAYGANKLPIHEEAFERCTKMVDWFLTNKDSQPKKVYETFCEQMNHYWLMTNIIDSNDPAFREVQGVVKSYYKHAKEELKYVTDFSNVSKV